VVAAVELLVLVTDEGESGEGRAGASSPGIPDLREAVGSRCITHHTCVNTAGLRRAARCGCGRSLQSAVRLFHSIGLDGRHKVRQHASSELSNNHGRLCYVTSELWEIYPPNSRRS
jgi:hypothetical protein